MSSIPSKKNSLYGEHFYEVVFNIPYILLGFLIFETESLIWGLGVVCLGVGSYYSHLTRDWYPDWVGMYLAFVMQSAHSLYLLTHFKSFYLLGLLVGVYFSLKWTTFRKIKYRFTLPKIGGIKFNENFVILGCMYLFSMVLSFIVLPLEYSFGSLAFYTIALIVKRRNHSIWHLASFAGMLLILLGFMSL